MQATKTAPTFLRTSFTEKLVFTAKPDSSTRRALRAAGFRWNGTAWWRNQNQTGTIKARDLVALLTPPAADEPDINDVIAAAV